LEKIQSSSLTQYKEQTEAEIPSQQTNGKREVSLDYFFILASCTTAQKQREFLNPKAETAQWQRVSVNIVFFKRKVIICVLTQFEETKRKALVRRKIV